MASNRIEGLDAIRGICAIAVLCMHSRFLTRVPLLPSAYLMVDIFFAMSGYVMAMIYGERLRAGGFFLAFVERRWTRLLPMWGIGLAFGVATTLLLHHHGADALQSILSLALGLVFLPTPFNHYLFPANAPGWSLFYEAVANIAFGLWARFLTGRTLVGVIAAFALALLGAVLHFGSADGGNTWPSAYIGVVRVGFSFSLGLLFHEKRARLQAIRINPILFWIFMAGIVLVALVDIQGTPRSWFDAGFILIGVPIILAVGLRGSVGLSGLARFLGEVSYPLYAAHFAVMIGVFSLYGALHHWHADAVTMPAAAVIMIALVGLAWLLARFVDRPVEEMLRRTLGRNPARNDGRSSPDA
jgi:peptidoglycan/LPS O-acetylase OafA/YrhL